MLTDSAKAQVVGLVVVGFAVVVVCLVCLVCPCPLRAAVDRCRRGTGKKNSGKSVCSCLDRCFGEEDEQLGKPQSPDDSFQKVVDLKEYEALPKPFMSLIFSVTRHTDCLIVYLYQADGSPGIRLGLSHNNFAIVQLSDVRSGSVLADVRTAIVRNTMSPVFNETLILSLPPDVASDALVLCIQCLDYDRFSQERVVAQTWLSLPTELEQTIQYNSVLSQPLPAEKGELLLALEYMPTAHRIRVILLKARHVLAPDRRLPSPYAHVALLLGGVTLYRKRTRIYDETSTPVFNEALSIELPETNLDRLTLVVSVMNCHLKKLVRPDLDACLGHVVFSASCYGSGRVHWRKMLDSPRFPHAYWHRLA